MLGGDNRFAAVEGTRLTTRDGRWGSSSLFLGFSPQWPARIHTCCPIRIEQGLAFVWEFGRIVSGTQPPCTFVCVFKLFPLLVVEVKYRRFDDL
jgi:hypothetical protein